MRRRSSSAEPADKTGTGRLPLACALVLISAMAALPDRSNADDGLSASAERGKRLYTHGESTSRRIITAQIQRTAAPVPAAILPCINCHGADGRGLDDTDAAPAPDINWHVLTQSGGHRHPNRKHQPFDDASLARAITRGLDPAGNKLDATMPRYAMADADMADLIAYLKQIGAELDPGLTADGIRIGTVLPLAGPLADTGHAIRDIITAYFSSLNASGGIHGRKLELEVAGFGDNGDPAIWQARDLLSEKPFFALVAPYLPGYDTELLALAEEKEVPLIGPYTLLPPDAAATGGHGFLVLAGLGQQAEALVEAVLARPDRPRRPALVYPQDPRGDVVATRLARRVRDHGLGPIENSVYRSDAFDAGRLAAELHERGVDAVVFLGGAAHLRELAEAAEQREWRPYLLAPALLAEREIFTLPPGFDGRVFLAYASLPSDRTTAGASEFERLHADYALSYQHSVAQVAAYTAARVLVEGLERAGRNPDRAALMRALETLSGFRPGLTPALTFGPARRDGAAGAHVVEVDIANGTLDAAGSVWIDLGPRRTSAQ